MDILLKGIPMVFCALDDILITGKNDQDHLKNLECVLQRIQEAGLKLRKDKCSFLAPSLEYLGHKIAKDGLQPLPSKVEAIQAAPSPTNLTELRAFLGLLTYYSRFIPNMSSTLAPLYNLLKKEQKWKWETPEERAFKDIKEKLVHSTLLVHFDPRKRQILSCDASGVGIGAVLSQVQGDNDIRPVAFASRTLTPAEKKYSQLEREALGIVFGVTRFRNYLLGNRFTLRTDHKPLVTLFSENKGIPTIAANRIQRWAIILSAYQYKIEYIKGTSNTEADVLSRLPMFTPEPDSKEPDSEPVEMVLLMDALDSSPVTSDDIRASLPGDPALRQALNYTLQGWSEETPKEIELMPYWSRRCELGACEGLLFWGNRVIIPTNSRAKMLDELHNSHQGIVGLKSVARTLFWWPGLDKDIEETVRRCNCCQSHASMPPRTTPVNWPPTNQPWDRVHIDHLGPFEQKLYLIVVDACTKWIEAIPVPNTSTRETIEQLRCLFARFGIPRTLVSDNGTGFTSEEFRQFMTRNGIRHLRTAPFHPSSNGLAERAVQTIKTGLKKVQQGSISQRLAEILLRYRRTPIASIGKSPSEMMFGRNIRSRLDLILPNPGKSEEPGFKVGESVWYRTYKSEPKWDQASIQNTTGNRLVTLQTARGQARRHWDQVRRSHIPDKRGEATEDHAGVYEPDLNTKSEELIPQHQEVTSEPQSSTEPAQSPRTSTPSDPKSPPVIPLRRSTDEALEFFADEILTNAHIKKWETVKDKLIARFKPCIYSPIVLASSRKLLASETVETYFKEKMDLLNQTSLKKEEKIQLLTDGLPLNWRDVFAAAQPADPTKWIQVALSVEHNRQQNSPMQIQQANSLTNTLGYVHVDLQIHNKTRKVKLHVIPNLKFQLLIGLDIAEDFELIVDTKDKTVYTKQSAEMALVCTTFNHLQKPNQNELNKLLQQNEQIFSQHQTDIGRISIQLNIVTKEHLPISLRPYRRPISEYEKISEQVKEMIKKGLIKESSSPWSFPVVLVQKKDGTNRLCVDYRELNKITIDDKQPLPLLQDIFDRLHGAKYFTTLDVAWGYWHVQMHPEPVPKTAFVTNDGHYEYLVMPFGLKNAASTFQKIIQKVIGTLLWKGVCVFQDDIIIYSSSFSQHMNLIKQVFEKLLEYNIKLKFNKCSFAQSEVKYLGHIIGHNKVKPDPDKIKAVQDFPQPTTVKGIRRFIGLANFYRKFIPRFAEIATPLTNLTQKNKLFSWTPQVDKSFIELKAALTSEPILTTYNPEVPCKLYTDALAIGIAGILSQEIDSTEHVISYYSKRLLKHQQNYSAFELECYAVIQAIDYFEVYLENKPFQVITDHSALQWLLNLKNPKSKFFRWLVNLSTKTFTITHRSGNKQTHVDALSRAPVLSVSIFELQQHQRQADLSFIEDPQDHQNTVMVKKRGLLRAVVPASFKEHVLKEYHDNMSHPSMNKTVKLIVPLFWWSDMVQEIKSYVRSCKTCQLTKSSNQPTLGQLIIPDTELQPAQVISADTIVMGTAAEKTKHKYIQVFIDHLTRYVRAFPTIKNTAQATLQCFNRILQVSLPLKYIITDNGKNFNSKEFKRCLKVHNIKQTFTTPYHPQSNGMCEKVNGTIMTKLRTALLDKPKVKWSTLLPKVITDYNNTPHDVTGFPPSFLLFGYNVQPQFADNPSTSVEDARKLAIKRTQHHREISKRRHDSRHPDIEFKVGDLVLKRIPYNDPKLIKTAPKYEGPFQVLRKLSKVTYELSTTDQDNPPRNPTGDPIKAHISQLKSFILQQLQDIDNWGELEQKVLSYFTVKDSNLFSKFLNLKYNDKDDLDIYFKEKSSLAKKLNLDTPLLLEALTDGMPNYLKKYLIAARVKETSDWIKIATQLKYSTNQEKQEPQCKYNSDNQQPSTSNDNRQNFQTRSYYPARSRLNPNSPPSLQSQPPPRSSPRSTTAHHQEASSRTINLPPYPCKICASHQLPNQYHFHRDCPLKNNNHPKRTNPGRTLLLFSVFINQISLPCVLDTASSISIIPLKYLNHIYYKILDNSPKERIGQVEGFTYPLYKILVRLSLGKITKYQEMFVCDSPIEYLILGLPTFYIFKLQIDFSKNLLFQNYKFLYSFNPKTDNQKSYATTLCIPDPYYVKNSSLLKINPLCNFNSFDIPTTNVKLIDPNSNPITDSNPFHSMRQPGSITNYNSYLDLSKVDINPNFSNQTISDILHKYKNVFSKHNFDIGYIKTNPICISLLDNIPIAQKPYRTSFYNNAEIQKQITELLKYDIIRPSSSPYSSPALLVNKKSDAPNHPTRLCIDYRKLNQKTVPEHTPIPLIEQIIDRLSQSKIYTILDVKNAYWHIPIDEKDRHKTSFVTQLGCYEWNRLPYGLKNAPSQFERIMKSVFTKHNIHYALNYFDDIIIHSKTYEEHIKHLDDILGIFEQEDIKLNLNKCKFLQKEIQFLGYTINSGKFTPNNTNIEAILKLNRPYNIKTLQRFLGTINIYNKFIPHYAQIRAPLNELLLKNAPWLWSVKHEQAFQTLKNSLISQPVLYIYDPSKPCHLFTDASSLGVAGVLKQPDEQGILHPIGYFSRKLHPYEQNYTASEIETLAIINSVQRFHTYLHNIHFTLHTDHLPLKWIKNVKNPQGRLFRWSLILSQYSFDIKHIKGLNNIEADMLSRAPVSFYLTYNELKEHQSTEQISSAKIKIQNGLYIINRRGFKRAYVPQTLRHKLLSKVHTKHGHIGTTQMTKIISPHYYWSHMTRDIANYTKHCETCQVNKSRDNRIVYGPLQQMPIATHPNHIFSLDTLGGLHNYGTTRHSIHMIVDHHSRFLWAFPTKSVSTDSYITCLRNLFQINKPEILITDRNAAFLSRKFKHFLERNNVKHLLTSSHHPETNAKVERLNSTIINRLRCEYNANLKIPWTKYIPKITESYNETVHTTTGFTPKFLYYGIQPQYIEHCTETHTPIEKARKLAIERTIKSHEHSKQLYDIKHPEPIFKEGDQVLVKTFIYPNTGKLTQRYIGPFTILKQLSPVTYEIDKPNIPQRKQTEIIHSNKLKLFYPETDFLLHYSTNIENDFI
ncbi:hypothetical protein LAZ67_5003116, partial [Cordylochernes scorpioides]